MSGSPTMVMPFQVRLRTVALALMAVAVLLLLAGWMLPQLWRPAWAEWRSAALVLLSAGAFLMWRHARQVADRQFNDALSSLTHSSLMPYEFAPVTLPMEDSGELAAASTTPQRAEDTAATQAAAVLADSPPASPLTPAPAAPLQWSVGLLRALEWRRFEALCEEIFKQDGYVIKTEPGSADRGADLWLHSRLDLQQPVRIVQCRNWGSEPVGVVAVREFLGAMVDAEVKSGALVTCGVFTPEAEALARRHAIMAVNGPELLALIGKRPEALQHELLAVATQGDYWRPTCRRCGLKMLAREAREGGLTHWVCESAPRCPGTLEWSAGPA